MKKSSNPITEMLKDAPEMMRDQSTQNSKNATQHAPSAIDRLSPKRQRFVREYALDSNATEAAIRAGYAKKSAYSQGHDLLKIPEIAAACAELQAETAEKLDITREWVINKLLEIHKLALEGNPVLDRYGNPTGKYIKQLAAANKSIDQVSELLGFKVDRKAVLTMDVSSMSDDALAEAEAKLKAELEAHTLQ